MFVPPPGKPGDSRPKAPPATRKTALIIWGALLGGVLSFAVVAAMVRQSLQRDAPEGLGTILGGVACGVAVLCLVASLGARRLGKPAGGVSPDQFALTRTIIAAALNEGAALFGGVAWLVTASPWAVLALAVSVVGFLGAFPSVGRWKALGGSVDPSERGPNRLVR